MEYTKAKQAHEIIEELEKIKSEIKIIQEHIKQPDDIEEKQIVIEPIGVALTMDMAGALLHQLRETKRDLEIKINEL